MIGEFGPETILWALILAVFFNYLLSLIKLNPTLEQQAPRPQSSGDTLMALLKQPKVIYFILVMGFRTVIIMHQEHLTPDGERFEIL